MSLTPYSPFQSLTKMMKEVDRLHHHFMSGDLVSSFKDADLFLTNYPQMTIKEHDDHWSYKFDIPGVEKENLKVSLNGNVVTLKGKREEVVETKDETKHYYHSESHYGTFSRSFTLNENTDINSLKAKHVNGVLTLTVNKLTIIPKESVNINVE